MGEDSIWVGTAGELRFNKVLQESKVRTNGNRNLTIDCLTTANSFHGAKQPGVVQHDNIPTNQYSLYSFGFLLIRIRGILLSRQGVDIPTKPIYGSSQFCFELLEPFCIDFWFSTFVLE